MTDKITSSAMFMFLVYEIFDSDKFLFCSQSLDKAAQITSTAPVCNYFSLGSEVNFSSHWLAMSLLFPDGIRCSIIVPLFIFHFGFKIKVFLERS